VSFYRVIPGSVGVGGSGTPKASDLNQYAKAFDGDVDLGAVEFAIPVVAPSTTPTATASAGAGLSTGNYVYGVTYVTGIRKDDGSLVVNGETTVSSASLVTTTGPNAQVALTSIPVSGSSLVIGKRIYRTLVGGAQLKLVTTLAADVTSYTDTLPDGSLGANVPTTNTTGTYLSVNEPVEDEHTATKGYVDSSVDSLVGAKVYAYRNLGGF